MTMRNLLSTFALMTCLALAVETASAQNFYEPFNTDTATAGTTYSPPFTFTPGTGGTAVVSGGVLLTTNTANVTQTFLRPGFAGSQRVSGLVGASNSNGNYNIGLVVGENNVVFHPGLAGGAFRVDGNGGFGNSTMNFNPANNTLYRMDVDQLANLGILRVSVTDTNNPSTVYRRSFVNPDSIGGTFGFMRSGSNTGDGRFDNLTVTPPAFVAGQVASHTFATNTANTAAFTAANPEFTFSGAGSAATSGGQLTMNNPAGGGFAQATRSGFLGEMIVTAKVGAVSSNGNYNVGLNIGGHNIVFHPGLAGGAFRVEGANGFGNTTMNFTPANGVLHDMVVHIFDNGLFDISVIDGTNPQNIFHASFVDVSWSGLNAAQRDVGFRVDGPNGAGLFDDLNIYQVVATPEPTTIALWSGVGAVGICWSLLRGRKPTKN